MDIRIAGLRKSFGTFAALQGVDLPIPSGQLLAVLGPSGAGKTTLLRLLAGLETPDTGRIDFGGRDATTLNLRQRRVGLVFQHFALFPHLNVFENVAFGLRVLPRGERPAPAAMARRVAGLLERMQIADLRERFPGQISGGQRQRVALARAMAIEPSVLLLDEPFGALDAKVRSELRGWLRTIHDQTGYTTVFVTHDQHEALELSDRLVVMREGRIEQDGPPAQVYAQPANAFVYDFLGRCNRLCGQVRAGVFQAVGSDAGFACIDVVDGPACLYWRPHDTVFAAEGGLAARAGAVRQIAGRRVLALAIPEQARAVEVDLPNDRAVPDHGAAVRLRPTAYRVYADAAQR